MAGEQRYQECFALIQGRQERAGRVAVRRFESPDNAGVERFQQRFALCLTQRAKQDGADLILSDRELHESLSQFGFNRVHGILNLARKGGATPRGARLGYSDTPRIECERFRSFGNLDLATFFDAVESVGKWHERSLAIARRSVGDFQAADVIRQLIEESGRYGYVK